MIVGVTGIAGARERITVRVRYHQHFTGKRALSDNCNETVLTKAHVIKPLTGRHLVKLTGAAPHCQKPARG